MAAAWPGIARTAHSEPLNGWGHRLRAFALRWRLLRCRVWGRMRRGRLSAPLPVQRRRETEKKSAFSSLRLFSVFFFGRRPMPLVLGRGLQVLCRGGFSVSQSFAQDGAGCAVGPGRSHAGHSKGPAWTLASALMLLPHANNLLEVFLHLFILGVPICSKNFRADTVRDPCHALTTPLISKPQALHNFPTSF